MNPKCNHIILSKIEIERMLKFAEENNDNVVLFYEENSIGTEYAVKTQKDFINDEGNITFITDSENW